MKKKKKCFSNVCPFASQWLFRRFHNFALKRAILRNSQPLKEQKTSRGNQTKRKSKRPKSRLTKITFLRLYNFLAHSWGHFTSKCEFSRHLISNKRGKVSPRRISDEFIFITLLLLRAPDINKWTQFSITEMSWNTIYWKKQKFTAPLGGISKRLKYCLPAMRTHLRGCRWRLKCCDRKISLVNDLSCLAFDVAGTWNINCSGHGWTAKLNQLIDILHNSRFHFCDSPNSN